MFWRKEKKYSIVIDKKSAIEYIIVLTVYYSNKENVPGYYVSVNVFDNDTMIYEHKILLGMYKRQNKKFRQLADFWIDNNYLVLIDIVKNHFNLDKFDVIQ